LSAVMLASAGCSIMPSSGPQDFSIKSGVTVSGPDFGLVKLTPTVTNILKEYGPGALAASFPENRVPPKIKFGIGDVVAVTIFEAAAGGLFIPAEAGVRPGNFVQLPNQNVDTDGKITVPYAGAIQAAGRTPAEIQQEIIKAIGNRAIANWQPLASSAVKNAGSGIPATALLTTRVRAPAFQCCRRSYPDGPQACPAYSGGDLPSGCVPE